LNPPWAWLARWLKAPPWSWVQTQTTPCLLLGAKGTAQACSKVESTLLRTEQTSHTRITLTTDAESAATESAATESAATESAATESTATESTATESTTTESATAESVATKPTTSESTKCITIAPTAKASIKDAYVAPTKTASESCADASAAKGSVRPKAEIVDRCCTERQGNKRKEHGGSAHKWLGSSTQFLDA
jgi:hypothetical protein